MATSLTSETVCKALSVALLLMGDMESAEEVTHEAIQSMDPEDLFSDALLLRVSMLSMQQGCRVLEQPTLPEDLRNILQLSKMPRYCFVLRILLGFPKGVCAALLQVDTNQIVDATCDAVCEMAAMNSAAHV